ncbi:MAG TPA: GTP 3',8-cyclase MoaA [Acidimicrobiales bacterium]|nr:GTP 3',8-cyclase MoaA [Acidimicrobiales bacterium]
MSSDMGDGVPPSLTDPFGRVVRDLRISVTDRCNLRCTYCMPEQGMDWLDRDELLGFDEIERVARVCVERFGFTGIRLTGGEPTVRHGLEELIASLATLGADLALTTNGVTLAKHAAGLRAAGLNRLNISLDSLRRERFLAMTRRDELGRVLEGIDAALAAGFSPVKLNVVLIRGVNDDEAVDFAAFGREKGVGVRFIEFMPLDADGGWSADSVVASDDVIAAIGAVFPLEEVAHGPEPAQRYRFLDGTGDIGVIPSVTKPFCGSCDRVRITAEGAFRTCLFANDEHDLKPALRHGTDDDLAAAIAAAVGTKWAGHSIGQIGFTRPPRTMSQIGG